MGGVSRNAGETGVGHEGKKVMFCHLYDVFVLSEFVSLTPVLLYSNNKF